MRTDGRADMKLTVAFRSFAKSDSNRPVEVMQYSEIIAVCSQIHTKHINTVCGQNVECFSLKPGGIYSNRWATEG
jgi:hypothetical protein